LDLKTQAGQLGAPQDAAMRRMEAGTPPETVASAVCTVCRVTRDELYGWRRKSDARAILMKLLIEYAGMTQRAVARHLGLTDGSGVSRSIAQLNRDLARSNRLKRLLRKAEIRIIKH
jgi:chromosomal replication initiation ATPase DnaA